MDQDDNKSVPRLSNAVLDFSHVFMNIAFLVTATLAVLIRDADSSCPFVEKGLFGACCSSGNSLNELTSERNLELYYGKP